MADHATGNINPYEMVVVGVHSDEKGEYVVSPEGWPKTIWYPCSSPTSEGVLINGKHYKLVPS
jgi:hypothetical protein